MPPSKVYLVTGANTGLGLDATRQLALKADTKKVYLACLSKSQALAAIDSLLEKHEGKITQEKLTFVPFDAAASKEEISKMMAESLPLGEKLDGLIFNAGGMGDDGSGKPTGPNKILDIVQINLLGHVHLLEALKSNNFLIQNTTRIIFSGSESARGVPSLRMACPKMPDTVEEYSKLMDGSGYAKFDIMDAYADVKGMATLYFAWWARQNSPDYFAMVVSPGGTSGTDAASHKSLSFIMRIILPYVQIIFGWIGLAHALDVGAKRYVDAVMGEGEYANFASGTYVASASGLTGPVADQTELASGAQYADETKQQAMYEAVQAYV